MHVVPLLSQPFNGMTLFSPTQGGGGGGGSFTTYLVDNDMNEINTWSHTRGVASMPYLLKDSTLVYPYRVQNPSMNTGGVGGGISFVRFSAIIPDPTITITKKLLPINSPRNILLVFFTR